ncbi:MAG: HPr(Ser) kinase/phosphatase, partial [Bacillales bacterium]|nr:HPr(Ser) kinase/phosphatase [Bacillales bacterium]
MISKAVSVRELIEDFHLTNVVPNADDSRNITVTDINRPGLELTGYYQHTELKRIVVLGNKEIEYINTFTDKAHFKEPFAMISSSEVPCIIITNNNVCPPDLYVAAKKNKTAILLTNLKSSQFITSLTLFLSEAMAPSLSLHGTLLEVSGVGLLLLGASGIGKSEIALDLVRRGHRLVADDSVEITYVSNALYGKAPEVLKRVIEVRGLGVIDVTNIFGISSYKERQQIDYVIQ